MTLYQFDNAMYIEFDENYNQSTTEYQFALGI
jgi:hypothetical protein